jgi:hypothetical protein
VLRPNQMTHYKQGILVDNAGDSLFVDGSCNFTAHGLLENGESISIYRSWGSDFESAKVDAKQKEIEEIAHHRSKKYEYLLRSDILNAIDAIGRDRTVSELMSDELNIKESG